jgi:hypothetical protein
MLRSGQEEFTWVPGTIATMTIGIIEVIVMAERDVESCGKLACTRRS